MARRRWSFFAVSVLTSSVIFFSGVLAQQASDEVQHEKQFRACTGLRDWEMVKAAAAVANFFILVVVF